MKYAAAFAAALALPAAALAETRTYEVDSFDAIEASNGVRVEVVAGGDRRSVTAEGPSEDLDQLYIHVKRGRLVVRPTVGNLNRDTDFFDVTVHVAAPDLTDIEVENGAELTVSGLVDARIELEATNGGLLTAEGGCLYAELVARRGGELDADDLDCARIKARASLGGEINARARDEADLGASWGATIDVEGTPERVERNNPVSADIHVR